jgi:hypothetical protein
MKEDSIDCGKLQGKSGIWQGGRSGPAHDSGQQREFLAMLRLDRREVTAVGREDAAYFQPLGDYDDGCIDEADIRIMIFFQQLGDAGQIMGS